MLTFSMTVDKCNTDRSLFDAWLIFFVVQVSPTTAFYIRCNLEPKLFYMSMTALNEYDRGRNLDRLLAHIKYRSKNPWT